MPGLASYAPRRRRCGPTRADRFTARAGSTDLTRIFASGGDRALANDTSCGAGLASLTDPEKAVLAVERALNSRDTKRAHPETDEDIKVMGVRHERRIHLAISSAFVGRFVSDLDDYARKSAAARALAVAAAQAASTLDVDATINAADNLGRGNRTCGLITPYRVMTLEAAAGKNPATHVGKVYSLLAGRIALSVATELHGIEDASCVMVSQIGRPVDDPQVVDIRLLAAIVRSKLG